MLGGQDGDQEPTGENRLRKRLARQIFERVQVWDLAAHTHLTEKELTAVFGVSRTPVRHALAHLASLGVLYHIRNHGYFTACSASELDNAIVENLLPDDEDLYRRVVRDLLDGEIGEEVRESDLQRRYGCGRATIRGLMAYMHEDGLVEKRPGQGWRFQKALTSRDSYDGSFRFRLLIEPAALLQPTFRADQDAIERFLEKHRRLIHEMFSNINYRHFYYLDAAFHEHVAAWSNNYFIWESVRNQNRLRRLTEYEFHPDTELFRESCRQHVRVLEAIQNDDLNRASAEMDAHIRWSWSHSPNFGRRQRGTPWD